MHSLRSHWASWLILLTIMASAAHCQTAARSPVFDATGPIERRHIRIPLKEAGATGLDAFLLLPRTPGKHPLVLLSNSWEHRYGEGAKDGPGMLLPEALWFAKRGWAVAMFLRRGYGTSGGKAVEWDTMRMEATLQNFQAIQLINAQDLRAVSEYVSALPEVDGTRIVVAGEHNAGSAAMWLAECPPKGLVAVLNFGGGWDAVPDWALPGKVHMLPDIVKPAFAELGEKAKVPMLWIYPTRGSVPGLKIAEAARDAFKTAGGNVEFDVIASFEDHSRELFGLNPDAWGPLVERFLADLQLPATEVIPTPHQPSRKELPWRFTELQKDAFLIYLHKGSAKAFAYSNSGCYGFVTGMASKKMAEREAMRICAISDCRVIASEECPPTPDKSCSA